MSTAPPLLLNRERAERLLQYMQEYRRVALTAMPITQERNTTLRLVQALQGKLLALVDQEQSQVHLPLTREEVNALKAMTKSLLLLYGEKPDSLNRTMTVMDVGKLYASLKQAYG
jgi:predicted Zn-dependent peptidase